MMTVKDLVTGPSTQHPSGAWEPALPLPDGLLMNRLRDAWAVLTGKAHAIRQTP